MKTNEIFSCFYPWRELVRNVSPSEYYPKRGIVLSAPKKGDWCGGGLCPFHDDRHIGNFGVNLKSGGFNCFACGAKGSNIIAFEMKLFELTFKDALQLIAAEWGLL